MDLETPRFHFDGHPLFHNEGYDEDEDQNVLGPNSEMRKLHQQIKEVLDIAEAKQQSGYAPFLAYSSKPQAHKQPSKQFHSKLLQHHFDEDEHGVEHQKFYDKITFPPKVKSDEENEISTKMNEISLDNDAEILQTNDDLVSAKPTLDSSKWTVDDDPSEETEKQTEEELEDEEIEMEREREWREKELEKERRNREKRKLVDISLLMPEIDKQTETLHDKGHENRFNVEFEETKIPSFDSEEEPIIQVPKSHHKNEKGKEKERISEIKPTIQHSITETSDFQHKIVLDDDDDDDDIVF